MSAQNQEDGNETENEEVIYDAGLKREVLKIKGLDGIVRNHILEEMNSEDRDNWMNQMGGRIRYKPDGSPAGVKDHRNLQNSLLTKCLKNEETEKFVPTEVLKTWSSSLVSALFDKARKMNALDEDAKEKAKND